MGFLTGLLGIGGGGNVTTQSNPTTTENPVITGSENQGSYNTQTGSGNSAAAGSPLQADSNNTENQYAINPTIAQGGSLTIALGGADRQALGAAGTQSAGGDPSSLGSLGALGNAVQALAPSGIGPLGGGNSISSGQEGSPGGLTSKTLLIAGGIGIAALLLVIVGLRR